MNIYFFYFKQNTTFKTIIVPRHTHAQWQYMCLCVISSSYTISKCWCRG